MSHISTAKVAIKGVKKTVAERAFQNVAMHHGYNYLKNQTLTAMDHSKLKVPYAFTGNGLDAYGGVGVNILNKELNMVGEFWGRTEHVNKLRDLIIQGYTAEAYRESLLEMGMSVDISYNRDGEIVIEGEVFN